MPIPTWRFESFELDREHRSLRLHGTPVAVTPKAFDVLALLVERHGQLVSKEEMLKTLWPDSYVEEGNLSVHISLLRKRLGDNAEVHRFILTVPGRGYQFVAPVTQVTNVPPAAGPETAPAAAEVARRPEIVWRRDESARRAWRWWAPTAACVLAALAWTFADRVFSRPASTVATVAKPEISPEAQRLYQRGRYLLGKRTAQALRRGITHFESALERDRQFASAHSGLADAYSMLGYFGFAAPRDVLPRAQAAAAQALALDPHSAAAHTSRAYILHRYEWRFGDAERSFVRAIELQPDYALARHWYGSFLESMNRYDEAIVQSAKAEELEPISPVISANLAGILDSAQHGSRAAAQWDKTLELDQAFWPVHQAMAEFYADRDMQQQALEALRRSVELSGESPKQIAVLARFHASSGRMADARRLLTRLEARAATEWISPADIASIHAALGERDRAFVWLERAIESRDPMVAYLAESRMWRTLRRDARFDALLQRVGLASVALSAASAGEKVKGSQASTSSRGSDDASSDSSPLTVPNVG
jgi:DNA-binding winged helix-turn-helix (wHTH) protein/Tfp pilus assembly protein PilF